MDKKSQMNEKVTPRANTAFVPRIALVIPDAEMLNHYDGILLNLPRESVCVLGSWWKSEEKDEAVIFARKHGFEAMSSKRAYESGLRFAVMVTHHPKLFHDRILSDLAETHVRMMYVIGKAGWNFRPWNKMYHTVLCYGPYHAEMLAQYPEIQLEQVGYPRFDSYFDGSMNREEIMKELGCDPRKQTVTWLPTWGKLSSVEQFTDAVIQLKNDYNLLMKLHPGIHNNPDQMEVLRKHAVPLVADRNINNVKMLYVTDYVLADYGGSPFGAINAGKMLLLLNVDDAANHEYLGEESLDLKLREWVLSVDADRRFDIPKILADDTVWDQQLAQYEAARSYFFAPFYQNSSRTAAHAMLDVLLKKLTAP